MTHTLTYYSLLFERESYMDSRKFVELDVSYLSEQDAKAAVERVFASCVAYWTARIADRPVATPEMMKRSYETDHPSAKRECAEIEQRVRKTEITWKESEAGGRYYVNAVGSLRIATERRVRWREPIMLTTIEKKTGRTTIEHRLDKPGPWSKWGACHDGGVYVPPSIEVTIVRETLTLACLHHAFLARWIGTAVKQS